MKKKNIIVFIISIVVILAISAVAFAMKNNSKEEKNKNTSSELEQESESYISYNGQKYQHNDHLRTYLYMGIDKDGPVTEAEDSVSGGQSDAMFLIVVDSEKKTISVLSINRNTMTDVDVYDKDGNFVDTRELQICLQHGFGDGMRTSCQRSVDAVSNLLYGEPISGYIAMNMDAMPMMNDSVGGVTVEVLDDLTSPSRNVSLHKGETVTLNGDEAYVYLRSRDINEFDSATERLNRQMQYIQAFVKQAKSKDTAMLVSAYDTITDYIVTNVDVPNLVNKLTTYEFDDSRMYTVPGETKMGEQYEEYHVDEDALYQLMLDVFYKPVE